MAERLVVIGGSAGSLDPLRTIVAGLPADFAAPVLVVMHVPAHSSSTLPDLLTRSGPLPARHARGGDPLKPGAILVAPPDRHLIVHDDRVQLSRGPRENRHRPAIDALFNSAARWHGPGVIGVVLSGVLDDGAAGAAGIAAQDGVVVVQDPEEAQCSGMPEAALRTVRRARRAPARDLAALVAALVREPVPAEPGQPFEILEWETSNVDGESTQAPETEPGSPVALGCPECQGGMFAASTPGGLHYVCHVGHSWSPETLLAAQREASEGALYNAASKLLEEARVHRRLAEEAERNGDAGDDHLAEADEAEQRAEQIQRMIRRDT